MDEAAEWEKRIREALKPVVPEHEARIAAALKQVDQLEEVTARLERYGVEQRQSAEEPEKRFYYCDNPAHPHGEIVQILTTERDPRCPLCGRVMTYGRYWSSHGNPDEEEEYEEVRRRARLARGVARLVPG